MNRRCYSLALTAGFTLIEVMVVLSVLAILALIALPTFTDKIIRDQIAEALPLANVAKPPVEAAWRVGQPLPADNAAAGLPAADQIVNTVVSALTIQDGVILITFGNRAHSKLKGKILSLRPAGVTGARVVPVTWLCGKAPPPSPMEAQGDNQTTVPTALLPVRCR
ncbi:MAG: pilin [Ramlibacter sp.]